MNIAYETYTLANGLKVILHEDHATPQAVIDIVYRVGSKDEDENRTGFAHLFEHFMFEGSKHIPSYDTPLQRVGGQNNAFTSADITNYYLTLPSNQLETGFWLESDRMLELAFQQESLDVQKSVVIEEYKQRYLNQPFGDANLQLLPLHFAQHPYRWATIGKEISHIEHATLEEVKDFFFGYYAPNNATLVVAGDIKVEETKRLIEKWFGDIPRRELKKHSLPQEPVQTAARRKVVSGNVPTTGVFKMFHIPARAERGYYIADLLTDLLSNGKSGLLFQQLVKGKQVASQANAFMWGMYHPGALSIDAHLADGVSVETYEAALRECLVSLQHLGEDDVQRMKNRLEATFTLQNTTLLNKAMSFAIADAIGDPNLVNTTAAIYQSITLEEVREAAKAFLGEENSSTLVYLPNPKPAATEE